VKNPSGVSLPNRCGEVARLMLTFLFWNLKRDQPEVLAGLVQRHRVDVLMLAECPILPGRVLSAVNAGSVDYFYVSDDCPKVSLYTRFSDEFMLRRAHGPDYTIREISFPKGSERPTFLLCVVHFPSKLRGEPGDQWSYVNKFCTKVLLPTETQAKHTRTILVGDLNMNPYEDGLVRDNAFHAVPTRAIAGKAPRTVKFETHRYFYNPMWRHFGERPEGHAGTYYLASPKTRADFWNVYDQVLFRSDVLPYFQTDEVRVLHEAPPDVSLLRGGIPDARNISDHLPILFRLEI
jgi:hypothetical protein